MSSFPREIRDIYITFIRGEMKIKFENNGWKWNILGRKMWHKVSKYNSAVDEYVVKYGVK